MKLLKRLAKLVAYVSVSILALLVAWLGSWMVMRLATPLLAPLVLVTSSVLGIVDPQEQYRLLATIRGAGICASLLATLLGLISLYRAWHGRSKQPGAPKDAELSRTPSHE